MHYSHAILWLLAGGMIGASTPQSIPPRNFGEDRRQVEARHQWKQSHDQPLKRMEAQTKWFGGTATSDYLEFKKNQAVRDAFKIRQYLDRSAAETALAPGLRPVAPVVGGPWTNLGPFDDNNSQGDGASVCSGRPTTLLPHPTQPQILYMATSGGGLWKCVNADPALPGDWTWVPVTDNLPAASSSGNLPIGAVAMSPADPETLFVGLGDVFDAQGKGFYISRNGGNTWVEGGSLGTATSVMKIHVLDANTMVVLTNAGIFRSTDGGTSFTRVLAKFSWTLVQVDAQTLVASIQDSTGGSTMLSTDGGQTWKAVALNLGFKAGRVTLANSASNPAVIYGLVQNGAVIEPGLLKSTDGGRTWSFQRSQDATKGLFSGYVGEPSLSWDREDGGQSSYNQLLTVDPENSNVLFAAANLALYRSMDAGKTWEQLTHWIGTTRLYAHADFHTATWSRTGPRVLYFGNDGGIGMVRDVLRTNIPSNPDGRSYMAAVPGFIDNRRNKGLATHLCYSVGSTTATTPVEGPARIITGLQDNGARVRVDPKSVGLKNSGVFQEFGGFGDGFGVLIHPKNANLVLGSSYYTNISKSTTGGTSFNDAVTGIPGNERGDVDGVPLVFFTKIVPGLADATGNTVYTFTANKVYKSTNFADSWKALGTSGLTSGAEIRNLASAPSNGQTLAVVTEGGTGFVSTNGGTSWTAMGSFGSSKVDTSYVWFDSSNDRTLYVASVSLDASSNHLWRSTDAGLTWTALDGSPTQDNGFPFGIPVHVIQNAPWDPQELYAGTDFGVYRSLDGGAHWARFGTNFPYVAVRDVYVATDRSAIRSATFGRGLWETKPAQAPFTASITQPAVDGPVSANQPISFQGSTNAPGTVTYQWSFGDGASATGSSVTHTFANPGTSDLARAVTLTVTDGSGLSAQATRALTIKPYLPLDPVKNGGFELGKANWSGTTGAIGIWSNQPAYEGKYAAWLQGNGTKSTESLYQTVALPAAGKITLSFMLRITTAEKTARPYDTLAVELRTTSGGLIKNLGSYSNVDAGAGYVRRTVDLSAYKGQTVRLQFSGSEDGSYATSFVLDAVSIQFQ